MARSRPLVQVQAVTSAIKHVPRRPRKSQGADHLPPPTLGGGDPEGGRRHGLPHARLHSTRQQCFCPRIRRGRHGLPLSTAAAEAGPGPSTPTKQEEQLLVILFHSSSNPGFTLDHHNARAPLRAKTVSTLMTTRWRPCVTLSRPNLQLLPRGTR